MEEPVQAVDGKPLMQFEKLRGIAQSLGFPLFGACSATDAPSYEKLLEWLRVGYHGGMNYFEKRKDAYSHPSFVLDGVRSILMLGMPYSPATSLRRQNDETRAVAITSGFGKVAAYASGVVDYHDLIHERLKLLMAEIRSIDSSVRLRGIVDSAPFMERDFAVLSRLGWIGKNTLLLNRSHGSYFFLAAVLLDRDIETIDDVQPVTDHCGTCTACMEACPTQAFPMPRVLDARRCISYLTIEHRDHIEDELARKLSGFVFGCDICQQVCPWNRMAKPTAEPQLQSHDENAVLDLISTIELDDESFRRKYRRTPLWRTKRIGLVRNALLVIGAQHLFAARSAVVRCLSDASPIVRYAAAWALREFATFEDLQTLKAVLPNEKDERVKALIRSAVNNSRVT